MAHTGIVLFDSHTGRRIVQKYCQEHKISLDVLEELIAAELEQIGKLRKRGLNERFDEILDQELHEEE